jgi:hypothetical protein
MRACREMPQELYPAPQQLMGRGSQRTIANASGGRSRRRQ